MGIGQVRRAWRVYLDYLSLSDVPAYGERSAAPDGTGYDIAATSPTCPATQPPRPKDASGWSKSSKDPSDHQGAGVGVAPVTRTALVTGSPERVAAVSEALTSRNCDVIRVDDPATLADTCAALGSQTVDHYVQLPVNVPSSGDTVVAKFQSFLAAGLLARFEAAAAVLETLRPNASVVLVAGNLPNELTAPDDGEARLSLLRVLVQAIHADTAPTPVRTVVVDNTRTADEIAAITVDPVAKRLRVLSSGAEKYPEMDYVDWRLEVLSLASIES